MKSSLALLLATGLSLAPFLRDTNSRAATKRAMEAYAKRDYPAAVGGFRTANGMGASPLRDYNLGTAQIAAGTREEGSTTLTRAMRDTRLREAALFNRGNAALASSAFDYAIRDYTAALRIQPGDAAAKRNLEIALRRKAQQVQPQKSGAKGAEQSQGPQSPQTAQPQPKGTPDIEALLRGVQQQEQEELARMRAQRAVKGHVGW